ncbi:putative oxidoreductase/Short-chain dehydrogenase [Rhodococcus sp. WAY2]|nr:putative oxidoreductase/Short-chain dehydrogenase [Rhodococcus sp. WAY2]
MCLVTGANSGLGFEIARALAEHGAHVALACRDPLRGADAANRISERQPTATVEVVHLDLGDLRSVETASAAFAGKHDRLDLLINNAGIAASVRSVTAQGFEAQLGVNHLGHVALTAGLLPALLSTPGSRVVSVSSYMHRFGRIRFDDLHSERRYSSKTAYAQSKLANLLFTTELNLRLHAAGAHTIALSAHPGLSATSIGQSDRTSSAAARPLARRFMQPPQEGALPILRAATDPSAVGDEFYGPYGLLQSSGSAALVPRSRRARDRDTASRLWEVSADATGADYSALKA